jgi:hypothetical protein
MSSATVYFGMALPKGWISVLRPAVPAGFHVVFISMKVFIKPKPTDVRRRGPRYVEDRQKARTPPGAERCPFGKAIRG